MGDELRLGADFNGPTYQRKFDHERLSGQILLIFEVMKDQHWRTCAEIHYATGDPHPSISAQLRHLCKPRFGGHTLNKRPRGDRYQGLWEYQLIPSMPPMIEPKEQINLL